MSSKQNHCANLKVNGCEEFVSQRGNILCDKCTEIKKQNSRTRRDQDMEEFIKKHNEMEKELTRLRQLNHEIAEKLELENKKVIAEYTKEIQDLKMREKELNEKYTELKEKYTGSISKQNNTDTVYINQLEKEIERLVKTNGNLRSEMELLVKEKENYDMNYSQLKIDIKTLTVENNLLRHLADSLSSRNDELEKENNLLRNMENNNVST